MGWGTLLRRSWIMNRLLNFVPSEELLICVDQTAYYKIDTDTSLAVAMVHGDIKEVLPVVRDKNDNEWTVVAICQDGEIETPTYLKIPKSILYIAETGQYACHGIRFDVDKNNKLYQSRDGALFSKNGSELISCVSEEFDKGILHDVDCIDYLKITSEESDLITIPDTVKKIDSLHIKCHVLHFEGDLPELGDISGVRAKKILVNQTLDEIPEDRYKALSSVRYNDEHCAEIITKSPELSAGVSTDGGTVHLSDEIKSQLSEFEPSESLLIYKYENLVSYYRIPGVEGKAAIALISNPNRDWILDEVKDNDNVSWRVVAVCREYHSGYDYKTLQIDKSIEHIVMSGKYACYGIGFEVEKNNPFYQSCERALFTKDKTQLLSYVVVENSEKFNNDMLQGVHSIGYFKITYDEPENLTIPSTVSRMDSSHFQCKHLRFEGDLPELGDFSDVRAEKIYINQPLKQIPREWYKKIASVRHGDRDYYRAEIVTKKPVLSTVVPTAPGFIGLTRVDNDEYEYINPRYIIKMEPVPFEKYDGEEKGTRVYYAAHGSERAIAVDYYEKLLDVDSKIKDAQEALAQSIGGLAGLLEKVNDLYNLSQDRF